MWRRDLKKDQKVERKTKVKYFVHHNIFPIGTEKF